MPNWSFIPYTSLPSKYFAVAKATVAFHPATVKAASRRIRRHLFHEFSVSDDKMYFLQRIVDGLITNGYGRRAHTIVLEAFGKPLFAIRNLAHTLQDPEDRKVYIVHLEEAFHVWRERDTDSWWEYVALLGLAGILGVVGFGCLHVAWPSVRPHALMGFYSQAGH